MTSDNYFSFSPLNGMSTAPELQQNNSGDFSVERAGNELDRNFLTERENHTKNLLLVLVACSIQPLSITSMHLFFSSTPTSNSRYPYLINHRYS